VQVLLQCLLHEYSALRKEARFTASSAGGGGSSDGGSGSSGGGYDRIRAA
jgi:hypothetical protein